MCHYSFCFHVQSALQKCAEQIILGADLLQIFQNTQHEIYPDMNSISILNINPAQVHLSRRLYEFIHFLIDQFTYRISCKDCLCINQKFLRQKVNIISYVIWPLESIRLTKTTQMEAHQAKYINILAAQRTEQKI